VRRSFSHPQPAWRVLSVVGACGLIAGSVAACTSSSSSSSSSSTSAASSVLTVADSAPPSTLDPAAITSLADIIGAGNLYVTLTRLTAKPSVDGTTAESNGVTGYLAKSWTVSPDGLTYTFALRPGLKFASGAPVDAAAVKYSFERALKTTGAAFLDDDTTGLITGIDTPGPYTVVLHLSQARPSELEALASPPTAIVDPTVVSKEPADWLASHDAGSGPYELASYVPSQSMVLKARPGFSSWAGWGPKAQQIDITFVSNDATLLLDAEQGTDVTLGLTDESAASLASNSAVKVVPFPTDTMDELLLAWSKPPFNNELVREALSYVIPYQSIVSGPVHGYGRTYFGPLSPEMAYFNAALSSPLPTDLAKAKALLKQSGVPLPVSATLTVNEGYPLDVQIAQVLEAAVKPAGFNFTIRELPTADFTTTTYGNGFQAELREDGPAVADSGYYLGYAMACKVPGVGTNASHMCIPQADTWLTQAQATASPATAQTLYNQITTLWRSYYPLIPLYSIENVVVLNNRVNSFEYTLDHTGQMYDWGV
jgi:peptide/nickel transport system substrate-binding protein